MLGLVQFFYTNVLLPSANSVANEAKRHNEIAQMNAFALVHRIDAFHWRNGRIANDWAEVRKAVGTLVDELGTEQTGKLTAQVNLWIWTLHWVRNELARRNDLNEQQKWWSVNEMNGELKKHIEEEGNVGVSKIKAQIVGTLLQIHFENLDQLIERRESFRQTLQEMSGVQLLHNLNVFLEDDVAKIVKLIRKCRQKEGVTNWFVAVHKPGFVQQCPSELFTTDDDAYPYKDSNAEHLALAYEQLLSNKRFHLSNQSEFADRIINSMPIAVAAPLWLFSAFVDDLLVYLEATFQTDEYYGMPMAKDTVMNELWTAWVRLQLLPATAQGGEREREKVKLCQVYCFLDWAIRKSWPHIGDTASFTTILDNLHWKDFEATTLLKNLNLNSNNDAVPLKGPICTESVADQLFAELTNARNFGFLHTRAIFTLIKRRTNGILAFLCSKKLTEIMEVKERIYTLIRSADKLDWLEMTFPDILHIDIFTPQLRIALYQCLLSSRGGSPPAQRAEARIVVPLLYGELSNRYALYYEERREWPIEGSAEEKLFIVWQQFWERIHSEMDTMTGVCMTMFMMTITDDWSAGEALLPNAFPSDQQLQNCVLRRARLSFFQRQWQRMEKNHFDFLRNFILLVFPEGELPAGANRRLTNLVGPKLFDTLWAHSVNLLKDKQMFDNDISLMSRYLAVLCPSPGAYTLADQLAHKMAADITVFVRLIEAVPRGAKFDKIWKEKKENQITDLYDSFFEMDYSNEYRTQMHFAWKLFDAVRSELAELSFLINEKKLRQKWDGMEKRAQRDAADQTASDDGTVSTAPILVAKLHAQTLQKLAFENAETAKRETAKMAKHFRQKLKTELSKSTGSRHQLLLFLELSDIKVLLEQLGIEFNEKEFEDDPTDEDGQKSTSDQQQTEKRKKKKNRKKGGMKKKADKAGESVQNVESIEKPVDQNERENVQNEEDQKNSPAENGEKSVQNEESVEKSKQMTCDPQRKTIARADSHPKTRQDREENSIDQKKFVENKKRVNSDQKKEKGTEMGQNGTWEETDQSREIDAQIGNNLLSFSNGEDSKEEKTLAKFFKISVDEQRNDTVTDSNDRKTTVPATDQKMNGQSDRTVKWHSNKTKNSNDQRTEIVKAKSTNNQQLSINNSAEQIESETQLIAIRDQLHRNNFVRLISGDDETARAAWHNLTDEAQFGVITVLLGRRGGKDGGKKYSNTRAQFLKYLAKWKKLRDQTDLDEHLFDRYSKQNSKQILDRNYVQNMQQIKFNNQTDIDTNLLIKILRENGFDGIEMDKQKQIEEELEKIRDTVDKWSNGTGALLLGGSSLMGVQTADSDIDTVCIVPAHIHLDAFFGKLYCLSSGEENKRQKCDDDSLFYMLGQLAEFDFVRAIANTSVPLIRLISRFGHQFDIVFASVAQMESISMAQLLNGNAETFGQLAHKMATELTEEGDGNLDGEEEEMVKIARMARSLSGYHADLTILEMVPNIDIFRLFVRTLKMWSKNHFIYNNVLGFLHGLSLYVMAAKICILYPSGTVPFLVQQFFFTYSLWEWPFPVQLAKVWPHLWAWSADKEQSVLFRWFGVGLFSSLSMPIISPGFPQQNAGFNINFHTAKIIQKAMREALAQLGGNPSAQNWEKLLQKRAFSHMYPHSFAIECAASSRELSDEFCGFVSTRIRVQLLRSNECVRGEVNFCHARSLVGCPGHILDKYKAISPNASCMVWLVGIDFKQYPFPFVLSADVDLPTELDAVGKTPPPIDQQNLLEDIVTPIVASFKRVVLGEQHQQHQKKKKKQPLLSAEAKKIQKFFAKFNNFKLKMAEELAKGAEDFVHLEANYVHREQPRTEWGE
ncbi:hypothetical protein niasHS_001309 [Heterodera schachtii]|uniref:polynucleotide adenylyltransferase n=1 Tax=Heterodera schachtii TaxID=97005 RepID=A0ABD2KIY7_HETSC